MDQVMTVQKADGLYARYGKPLEAQHRGEYAAITEDGRVVTGTDDLKIAERALHSMFKFLAFDREE